jgi:hypothetical protein
MRAVYEYTSTSLSQTTSPQDPWDTKVLVLAEADVPSKDVRPPEGKMVTPRAPTAVEVRKVTLEALDDGTVTAVTSRVV